MITKENLQEVLEYLGFTKKSSKDKEDVVFKKIYQDNENIFIEVDFKREEIIYPKEIIQESKTTSNFSQNENFVVLECVDRLLDRGYQAKDLVLEKTWILGHSGKSGRADITIFKENQVYCIIECKTALKEYENARKDLFNNEEGRQLFSYAAQARSVEFLALYASDLITSNETKEIKRYETIIKFKDDENILDLSKQDSALLTFASASEAKDFFHVWEETYKKQSYEGIIFNSKPYEIGIKPLYKRDLKTFDKNDGINIKFQEILRHNSVSDKENAFNKLLSLFLCKCVDEQSKKEDEELDFQYKVGETYISLYERLLKLFIRGMNEFLKEEVYKTKDNFIANTIEQYTGKDRETMKKILEDELLKATLYSSNAFSFKETHNENLFKQNGKILVEVVELLSPYKISYSSKNQFLGDLFETFLNEGFKEDEGRYFTPMPITRFIWNALPFEEFIKAKDDVFPKVLDFACGSGHFLIEGISAISDYCKEQDSPIKDEEISKNFYGIDKDNRLARTTQVAMLLNGANETKIRSADGLEYNSEFYGERQQIFDILVSNPPYSVKNFKSHLNRSVLKGKDKFIPFEVLDFTSFKSEAIENVFVERLTHILKPKAIAAIILPSSILSNLDLATKKAREILLCNFALHAIVSFGNQTFPTTGTNTVVLFLKRFDEPPKKIELLQDSIKAILEGEDLESFVDKEIFKAYLNLQEIEEDIYKAFLKQEKRCLENEYFRTYYKSFSEQSEIKNLKKNKSFKNLESKEQEELLYEKFFVSIRKKEKEKLIYFALTLNQKTLIVKSPKNVKEQKRFLGYTVTQAKTKASGLIETEGLLSDKNNRNAEDKIAYAIKQSFKGVFYTHKSFEKYISYTYTCHLLNFENIDFTKTINLDPAFVLNGSKNNSQSLNPFENCKYELVKLGEISGLVIKKGKSITEKETEQGNIKVVAAGLNYAYLHNKSNRPKNTITISASGANAGFVNFWDEEIFASDCTTINSDSSVDIRFIYYTLQFIQKDIYKLARGNAQPHVYSKDIESLKIPLPPLEMQQQIVSECEKVEEQYRTIRMTLDEYQKLIKAVLVKCGVCQEEQLDSVNDAGGGVDNPHHLNFISHLIARLSELESKLDWDLIFKIQSLVKESNISTHTDSYYTPNKVNNANVFTIKTLLEELSIPPKEEWNRAKLSNDEQFDLSIGKRVLDSELKDQGVIPVYSANVLKPFGFIDKELLRDYSTDSVLWGIDGDWLVGFIPKNTPFYPTDHCGVLRIKDEDISAKMMKFCLEEAGRKKGFCRSLRASIERVKSLNVSLPPLQSQQKIVSIVEKIESTISYLDSFLPVLEAQKQRIIQEALM